MVFEAIAVIALVIFIVLAYFIIRTLLSFQRSLHRLDHLMKETEIKMRHFDSLFHSISNLGDMGQAATGKMKRNYFASHEVPVHAESAVSDFTELLVAGLKLGKRILTRRE